MPLLDPRIMTLQPTATKTPTYSTFASKTPPLNTVSSILKDTANTDAPAPTSPTLLTNFASKAAPTFDPMMAKQVTTPETKPVATIVSNPTAPAIAPTAQKASAVDADIQRALLVDTVTKYTPDTVESEDKDFEVTRLPAQTQSADEATAYLVAETQKQAPVTVPILPATPKVTASTELLKSGTRDLASYNVASAYGSGSSTTDQATAATIKAPAVLEPSQAKAQQIDLTHEALVQMAAQQAEIQNTISKPLIPPARAVATKQAEATQVTVASALSNSSQAMEDAVQKIEYLQQFGNAEQPPPVPSLPGPVAADYTESQMMQKVKKYGPYIAAGAIVLMLLRR